MATDPILERWLSLCRRQPRHELVVSPAGEQRWQVADVERLSETLARRLEPLPVGSIVAVAVANGPGFLAALLAVLRGGRIALLIEARAPEEERLRIARHLRARALLQSSRSWPSDDGDLALHPLPDLDEPAPPLPPGTAVLKLTSGSTGEPRGVAVSRDSLLADEQQLTATMGLRDDERILAAVPLSHSYGLSSIALPCLLRGMTLVVPPSDEPLGATRAVRQGRVSFLPTVPAYLNALVASDGAARREPLRAPDLRLVVSAGAPLPPETAQRFRARLGLPVHAFYGSTETGGIAFDRSGDAGERGTLGTPVAGVEVVIAGDPSGPVTVRSPAVATAYWPDADERLGDGRFHTADVGRWREGELELLGRADDVINVRGKKVFPREVELVLLELPGVSDAVVLASGDSRNGRSVVRAVLEIGERRLSAAEVRSWCRRRLAPHKVPRRIELVGRLPRTERGKVDRAALRSGETAGTRA